MVSASTEDLSRTAGASWRILAQAKVITAMAAVATSMYSTASTENRSISSAPAMGATTAIMPLRILSMPPALARYSGGTIRGVVDIMAGWWNICPMERRNSTAITAPVPASPRRNSRMRPRVTTATALSAPMTTVFRFSRSMTAPAKGPRIIRGTRVISVDTAKICSEPVVSVSHQIKAKSTRLEPNREKACPVHTVKNVRFHPARICSSSFWPAVPAAGGPLFQSTKKSGRRQA